MAKIVNHHPYWLIKDWISMHWWVTILSAFYFKLDFRRGHGGANITVWRPLPIFWRQHRVGSINRRTSELLAKSPCCYCCPCCFAFAVAVALAIALAFALAVVLKLSRLICLGARSRSKLRDPTQTRDFSLSLLISMIRFELSVFVPGGCDGSGA